MTTLKTPILLLDSVNFIRPVNDYFNELMSELSWEHRDMAPRKEYYCNEIPVSYVYGNKEFPKKFEPMPWHPAILEIKETLESLLNTKFEVCFLNRYDTSSDYIGWHSDNSPEMDDCRPIAIVSLGSEREIWFKPIPSDKNPNPEVEKVKLKNGSVCVMSAGMQDTHMHRIPKAGFNCGPRISLTFRGYSKNEPK